MILQNGKRIDGCSDTVPVGTLQPYLGLVPPKGYLVCQGQLVSKITYSKLYEICGDTFGVSTETHFYLPDLRGKTLAGYDENDTAMNTIGKLLGQKTHTHTSAAHTHTTGNHTLTIAEIPAHNHRTGIQGDKAFDATLASNGNTANVLFDQTTGVITTNTGGSGAHNHGNTGSTTPNNTGSNTNYQPTITVNWIVKAVMLIPDYIIVEDKLTSDSAVDALSARQGKLLNEKFADYATKSEMIQYLPLSGGTLTGAIELIRNHYQSEGSYGFNANNSDIIGVNGLYWEDVADSQTEGIHFYKSTVNGVKKYDSLKGYQGNLIWIPDNDTDSSIKKTEYQLLGTHNTKDYVVEYGTNGNWRYRKWNSGTAECWGSFVHTNSVTCDKAWGVVYETPHIGGAVPNYPISFVEVPHSSVDVQGMGSAYMSLERMGQSKTHIGSLYMTRPNTGTVYSAGFTITVHAIGRWK